MPSGWLFLLIVVPLVLLIVWIANRPESRPPSNRPGISAPAPKAPRPPPPRGVA